MRAAVLAYHAIGHCPTDAHNLFISEEDFARQMSFVARRRNVVPLGDLLNRPEPGMVAITFDDGYRSVYERALPVLERFGFPATVFVPTAYIGKENQWDEPTGCPLQIMNEPELRDAAKRGLDVQSHGHDHIDMSSASEEAVAADLQRSVEILTSLMGPPRYLAYPFRTGSESARRVVAAAGFEAAFSIDCLHGGHFAHERVQITPRDSDLLFKLKTTGRYLRLRHAPPLAVGYAVLKRAVASRADR